MAVNSNHLNFEAMKTFTKEKKDLIVFTIEVIAITAWLLAVGYMVYFNFTQYPLSAGM